jgi:hypothetical protein
MNGDRIEEEATREINSNPISIKKEFLPFIHSYVCAFNFGPEKRPFLSNILEQYTSASP